MALHVEDQCAEPGFTDMLLAGPRNPPWGVAKFIIPQGDSFFRGKEMEGYSGRDSEIVRRMQKTRASHRRHIWP